MNENRPPEQEQQSQSVQPGNRLGALASDLVGRVRAHPVVAVLLAGLIGGLLLLASVIAITPGIKDLQQARASQPSELRYADGTVFDSFRQIQQERIPLERISPFVVSALIATEDRRFYSHHGVDFLRTASAIVQTIGGAQQGGSTITQQLARNMFPEEIGNSRSLTRKLKEMVTAFKIERTYSKQQILEAYLNTMPFLYNVFGIELAARTYFDKSAAELNLLESATLVGMLKGTSYYNPVVNPDRALKRRNVVLAQMVKYDQLSDERFQVLRTKPMKVRFNRPQDLIGPQNHFAAHVRKWLVDWADQHDYNLQQDGLIVHTTIDARLQKAAERAVEQQASMLQNVADVEWGRSSPALASQSGAAYASLRKQVKPFQHFWNTHPDTLDAFVRESADYKKTVEAGQTAAGALNKLKQDKEFMAKLMAAKSRLEAGFVAIDPSSGEIRAWVGSRDFQRDHFDHVAQAERQPGSTFKPLVYGAALENGMQQDRLFQDTAVEIRTGGAVWRPTDMSGPSEQAMPMREGLIYSKNTITAQVMQGVGLPKIITMAQAAGIDQSKLEAVPSLALGTSPVTLLEMVTAYATIAQQGSYRKPVFIKRITDRHGKVLAEFGPETRRAMSAETADALVDMMRGVVNRGTGQAIRTRFGIQADVAGKTGTTQNNTDGWFILMHPNLVAGAWVGFNDTRVAMRSNYWGQGGHNAIMLVGDFFQQAIKEKHIDGGARFTAPVHESVVTAGNADGWDESVPYQGRQDARRDGEVPQFVRELERVFSNIGRSQPQGGYQRRMHEPTFSD